MADGGHVLYTRRLELRKITVDDIPSLVKYANNKKISDLILNIPHPFQEPDGVFRISYVHQGFKNKSRFIFGIIFRESSELVGEIGLHVESHGRAQLGFWVGEPFWNSGIATEAAEAILEFGFENLGLETIYAECHIENEASQKVLLKNRMRKKGSSGSVLQFAASRAGQRESSAS